MTLTAGVHHGIEAVTYHSDPCAEPSLTSSGIKRLLSGSPAEFAARHPKITQWLELCDEKSKAKDLGTIIHALVLGTAADYQAVDPQDLAPEIVVKSGKNKGKPYQKWSGDAGAWKDAREEEGKLIISKKDGASVVSAAESMIRLLTAEYGEWPLGDSEVTLIWQRATEYGPIWCRARPDHLALRQLLILDPKSTSLGVSDRAIDSMVAKEKWAIQAAWYMEGVEACFPDADLAGRLTFRFPLIEIDPPYQSLFVDMSEARISIARQRIDRAANIFAKCLRANQWPERSKAYEPELLQWEVSEFQAEEAMNGV